MSTEYLNALLTVSSSTSEWISKTGPALIIYIKSISTMLLNYLAQITDSVRWMRALFP
ncbi:MAG: hypothetical protein Q8L47_02345 [bacterium]|nr:hypothetical protein [bacterium]